MHHLAKSDSAELLRRVEDVRLAQLQLFKSYIYDCSREGQEPDPQRVAKLAAEIEHWKVMEVDSIIARYGSVTGSSLDDAQDFGIRSAKGAT